MIRSYWLEDSSNNLNLWFQVISGVNMGDNCGYHMLVDFLH